jgi:hypothetical protein
MAIKYTISRPSQIYPNLNCWFENKTSDNPDLDQAGLTASIGSFCTMRFRDKSDTVLFFHSYIFLILNRTNIAHAIALQFKTCSILSPVERIEHHQQLSAGPERPTAHQLEGRRR